jgi:hypothetical protein
VFLLRRFEDAVQEFETDDVERSHGIGMLIGVGKQFNGVDEAHRVFSVSALRISAVTPVPAVMCGVGERPSGFMSGGLSKTGSAASVVTASRKGVK